MQKKLERFYKIFKHSCLQKCKNECF